MKQNFMNYPRISVVTPSYNQAAYIENTIISVLSQNYPNLEYIIIDAGSSDGTLDIIKKYQDQLYYWVSEKDCGLYDGVYKGFEIATGEILAWINSDDVYLPNSFFTVAEVFNRFPQIKWLQGANSHIDEFGRIISVYPSKYWTRYDFSAGSKWSIQQESTFFKSCLWRESNKPLNRTSQLAGDYGLWFTFFKYTDLYIISAPIGCFRIRSSNQKSLTHKKEYLKEKKEIFQANKNWNRNKIKTLLYAFLHRSMFFYFIRFLKMEVWFKKVFFNGPPILNFNRKSQFFELK